MLVRLRETVTTVMCHLELRIEAPPEMPAPSSPRRMTETRSDPAFADSEMQMAGANGGEPRPARAAQPARMPITAGGPARVPPGWVFAEALGRHIDPRDPSTWGKVPRNATCPCGTGKKFKHCHGRMA
jgi:preprotein translocase subunit SecA